MLLQDNAHEARSRPLIDGHGRCIDHLRLSLIDDCNLTCRYCSTADVKSGGHRLNIAFAVAVVRWLAHHHGIRHVRLTGGEPLLHPHLLELVRELNALGTLDEITLTTNAQILADRAAALRQAGIARVNISLDTLDATRFTQLTCGGQFSRTIQGIEAALTANLTPVRINMVVQYGINHDEICRMAEWGLARGCLVRFLEIMPLGPARLALRKRLIPAKVILQQLAREYYLQPLHNLAGQPAIDYAATSLSRYGPSGILGVIPSWTRPFCRDCRRLRITSQGEILSCLFDSRGVNLQKAWHEPVLDESEADKILHAAVMAKPAKGQRIQKRSMISIGG